MSGWIKIDRDLSKHWLWEDPQKLKWWFDLLFHANWEGKKKLVGNTIVIVGRGQLLASHKFLSKRWRVSVDTVRKFLRLLQSDNMIEQNVYPKYKLITITNYEKYQDNSNPSDHPNNNPISNPNDNPSEEYKEGEEINNNIPPIIPQTEERKTKRTGKAFVKPTLEEVAAYCRERNNGIDPQAFIDYYESCGWMVGKKPMRDWKAAVRTWENKRKANHPQQPISAVEPQRTEEKNGLTIPSELERARAAFNL